MKKSINSKEKAQKMHYESQHYKKYISIKKKPISNSKNTLGTEKCYFIKYN